MIWHVYNLVLLTVLFFALKTAIGQTCEITKCTSCSGSTCHSCVDGYFPSGKNCIRCTYTGCETCSDSGSCDKCTTGYWGPTCNDGCRAGCEGYVCDMNNGSCTCKLGYYGIHCENLCMSTCHDCTDGTQCSMCPVGRHGPSCSLICDCSGGSCDIVTGTCDGQCPSQCTTCSDTGLCTACQTGFYGTQCSQTCSSSCDGGCEINTGMCFTCNIGYYGPQCDQQCSLGCNNLGCHQNGTCYECNLTNMYGLNCNMQCPSVCHNNTCHRWTGTCPFNCDSQCQACDECRSESNEHAYDTSSTNETTENTTACSNNTAAVVGSVMGVVILILVVVIVVLVRKIRCLQSQPSNIYQDLDTNRPQRTYDNINREGSYEVPDPSEARVTLSDNRNVYYNDTEKHRDV